MRIWKGKFRLLPLLVLIGLLSFAVRSGEFVNSLSAYAEAQEEEQKPLSRASEVQLSQSGEVMRLTPQAGDETGSATQDSDGQDDPAETAKSGNQQGQKQTGEEPPDVTQKWKDAVDTGLDTSTVQREMLQDLAERKQRLARRSQQLAQREALLKAAEKELDRKFNELAALRDDIKDLLKEQSEEEQARINSLVKIYSGMKAKDAARIFNTLDIDILVDIMTRMSERKTGPVLAEMESEKARAVTIRMAEQKKLPELPQNLRN